MSDTTNIKEAYSQGKLGVSRHPPHRLVNLDDEPDATLVPPSSIFGPSPPPQPAQAQKRGSNYTPPKKRRKRRR